RAAAAAAAGGEGGRDVPHDLAAGAAAALVLDGREGQAETVAGRLAAVAGEEPATAVGVDAEAAGVGGAGGGERGRLQRGDGGGVDLQGAQGEGTVDDERQR